MPTRINLIGHRFGKLLVKEYLEARHGKWLCICDCGEHYSIGTASLKNGKAIECKKCLDITNRNRVRIDFTGKEIEGWKILKYLNQKYECICVNGHKCYIQSQLFRIGMRGLSKLPKCKVCALEKLKIEFIGRKIGIWTVLDLYDRNILHPAKKICDRYWKCQCDCGFIKILNERTIKHTRFKNCNNCKKSYLGEGVAALNNLYSTYKINAKSRKLKWKLTFEQFKILTKSNCYYTNLPPSSICKAKGGNYVYNGIDRLDNTEGYTIENSVPCNSKVNRMKMDLPYGDFVELCALITSNLEIGKRELNINKLKAI